MLYEVASDIELAQELLGCSRRELACRIGLSNMTLNRCMKEPRQASERTLSLFYEYAFSQGLRFNKIKAQLYKEDFADSDAIVLFHGSKSGIEGPLSLGASRSNNDFGRGFYCGESFEQSAMFVARFPQSSVYMVAFFPGGLSELRFSVDQDWMLAVALFRGKLSMFADHPRITQLRQRVEAADYLVAPIADNRMFEIIDSFIEGEITDEQCRHCLSATNLGLQYVFTTPEALERVAILEQCFLCRSEKDSYLSSRSEELRTGLDKVKAAKRQYRGRGRYIEEVLS